MSRNHDCSNCGQDLRLPPLTLREPLQPSVARAIERERLRIKLIVEKVMGEKFRSVWAACNRILSNIQDEE